MAPLHLDEIKKGYDDLDCGLILVDDQLKIQYLNRWVKDRQISTEIEPFHIKDLFAEYDAFYLEKLVSATIQKKTTQVISHAFHSWLVPLFDPNFEDKLMRQRGIVSFTTFEKNQIEFAGVLIQLRNVSNLAIQNEQLKSYLKKSQDLQNHLSDLNQTLEERVEERTVSLKKSISELHHEVVERKKVEKSAILNEQRFRSMIESLEDMAYICSEDLEIIYANPAMKKRAGRDIIGGKCHQVLHNSADKCEWCMWETIKQGNHSETDIVSPVDNRSYRIYSSPIFNKDGTTTKMTIHRDITSQKELEKSILLAKNEAETNSLMKSRFISMISHEIRNPLHAIMSFSDFGIKKAGKVSKEKVIMYFDRISFSAKRVLVLVNDLLDLSKMEAGKMDYVFSKNDIVDIIEKAIAEQNAAALEKRIQIRLLRVGIQTKVFCDASRIMQVVTNLLSNSIKFSPDGLSITISLGSETGRSRSEYDKSGANYLVVKVKDSGYGIPPEELESIFQNYIQSSKNNSTSGGTGLGLPICRSIVKEHSGWIWAENNPEGGTIFCFTLPYEPSDKMTTTDEINQSNLLAKTETR